RAAGAFANLVRLQARAAIDLHASDEYRRRAELCRGSHLSAAQQTGARSADREQEAAQHASDPDRTAAIEAFARPGRSSNRAGPAPSGSPAPSRWLASRLHDPRAD